MSWLGRIWIHKSVYYNRVHPNVPLKKSDIGHRGVVCTAYIILSIFHGQMCPFPHNETYRQMGVRESLKWLVYLKFECVFGKSRCLRLGFQTYSVQCLWGHDCSDDPRRWRHLRCSVCPRCLQWHGRTVTLSDWPLGVRLEHSVRASASRATCLSGDSILNSIRSGWGVLWFFYVFQCFNRTVHSSILLFRDCRNNLF